MVHDDEEIQEITEADVWKRKWKHKRKGRPPHKWLPNDLQYQVMLICTSAAGDVTEARRWYEEVPLSEVYRWLAVKMAEQPED